MRLAGQKSVYFCVIVAFSLTGCALDFNFRFVGRSNGTAPTAGPFTLSLSTPLNLSTSINSAPLADQPLAVTYSGTTGSATLSKLFLPTGLRFTPASTCPLATGGSISGSCDWGIRLATDNLWSSKLVGQVARFNYTNGPLNLSLTLTPSVTLSSTNTAYYTYNNMLGNDFAFGDLNSDGYQDLVITDGDNNTMRILLGQAGGGFGAPSSIGSFDGVHKKRQIKLTDMNVDGKLDAIVVQWTNTTSHQILVYMGNGSGGFAAPVSTNLGAIMQGFDFADMNNDGKLDLLASFNLGGGNFQARVYLGAGAGTFTLSGSRNYTPPGLTGNLTAIDVNNDGKRDAVLSNGGYAVLQSLGDGAGGLGATSSLALNNINGFIFVFKHADINADGHEDLILGEGPNLDIFLANAGGGFATGTNLTTLVGSVSNATLVDYDADGKLDLFALNTVPTSYPGVEIFKGDGAGGFTSAQFVSGFSEPFQAEAWDVNGDGRKDLVVSNMDAGGGNLSVRVADATSKFATPSVWNKVSSMESATALDFDNDGALDFVTAGGGNLYVNQGNGDGTFTSLSSVGLPVGGGCYSSLTTDLNNDGKGDVVLGCNWASSEIVTLLGDGLGGFTVKDQKTVTDSIYRLDTADFNGDLKQDVIYAGSSNVQPFLGDGAGDLTAGTVLTDPSLFGAQDISAADLNGDGYPDVVLTGGGTTGVMTFLGAGDGTFTYAFGPYASSSALALGDINGDQILDLVVATTYNAYSMTGVGDGTFSGFNGLGNIDTGEYCSNPYAKVRFTDLNGDGIQDFFTTSCTGAAVGRTGNGSGGFTAQRTTLSGGYWDSSSFPIDALSGDFNSDGKIDVLVPYFSNYGAAVYYHPGR